MIDIVMGFVVILLATLIPLAVVLAHTQ